MRTLLVECGAWRGKGGEGRGVKHSPEQTLDLDELRRRIAGLEGTRREAGARTIGSGCDALDELLPEKGFRPGTLIEWLSAAAGGGAGTLALLAARQALLGTQQAGGEAAALVVLDSRGDFCPPAAVRLGIAAHRLVVIHPGSVADHHWAMNQALRSSAAAAVLAWPPAIDDRTFRRWQLAAEEGGGFGLLVRPAAARVEPSWADVRLLVEPRGAERGERGEGRDPGRVSMTNLQFAICNLQSSPLPSPLSSLPSSRRRLRITVLRCRGGTADRSLDVELDDETYLVHPVARLAAPTARRRLAGA